MLWFFFLLGIEMQSLQHRCLLCKHLAKDSPTGQRLLWLQYLQLRVHQLISTTKSLPGVPVGALPLPAAAKEGK